MNSNSPRQTVSVSAAERQALHGILQSITPIPDGEWQWLAGTLKGHTFAAGDELIHQGGEDARIHFILYGLVRYFYRTKDGLERNHTFAAEENLVGCLPVYTGAGACSFTVAAIELTRTLEIPAEVFLSLDDRHECWLRMKLRLMQFLALRKEAREASFLLDSAEARYRHYLDCFQHLAERIPQYHVASYLGITPVALSRIRKRINPG